MRHLGSISLALALTFGLTSTSALANYTCAYVAKKRGGLGAGIMGTHGFGKAFYGPYAPKEIIVQKRLQACNTAQRNCNAKLALRKLRGMNPNAKCVFTYSKKS